MPSGGARPGAGRPKGSIGRRRVFAKKPDVAPPVVEGSVESGVESAPVKPVLENRTPLQYMLDVMNDPTAEAYRRDRMAAVAAPYLHGKAVVIEEPKGKKAQRAVAAVTAQQGTAWDALLAGVQPSGDEVRPS